MSLRTKVEEMNRSGSSTKLIVERSEDEAKVLRRMKKLVCVARKMSAIGCSGHERSDKECQFSRKQEVCKQGWMSDTCEPLLEEWEVWLSQKEKERREADRLEQHQAWVEKLLDSGEGGSGMLHSITTPRPWTAGAQVIEDVFVDVRQLKRVVKRQHWKDHWQVNTPEPLIENTPWKNKDLQDAEEAFLHTKAEELKRAASRYMASTGVGADGFHPKVPADLSTETCGYIVVVLAKVEQCGYWPIQASTHLFFLIPKNVTSERPNCFAAFSHGGNG